MSFSRKRFVFPVLTLCFLLAGGSLFAQEKEPIEAVRPFVEAGEIPGVVILVGTPDDVLYWEKVGYADVESKKEIEKDSLFWIASMTKAINAAGVMVLVDAGLISLDDPISKFYSEFEQLKVAEPLDDGKMLLRPVKEMPTIRQMLCHTAGFPFLTPFMVKFGIDSLPGDQVVCTSIMTPMTADPQTQFIYSNIGCDIAGAIVEKVSGMRLEDFLRTHLFEPLEMPDTTFFPNEEQRARLAKSYKWDANGNKLLHTNIVYLGDLADTVHRYEEGGGGLFSTAPDVFHFYQMLANNGKYKGKQVLSSESVAEMIKDQTGGLVSYGFGLAVGGDHFGHGGAYCTDAIVFPSANLIGIYMIQVNGVPQQNAAKETYINSARSYFKDAKK